MNPIPCAFLPDCRKQGPEHSLLELPEISPTQESSMHQLGIETLDQIDREMPGLTPTQRRALLSLRENRTVVEPTVSEEFETIVYPLCFIATHLSLQVLPRFEHTRPWQHLPYQWSAHILGEDGAVEHRRFLINSPKDPRPEFVHSLLECIDDVGTVVTWSKRLEPCLRQIMEDLPALKEEVKALLQMDPLALDALTRDGVYHPDFRGGFDLATIYGALTQVPPPGDADEGIRDDEGARTAFEKLNNTRTRAATRIKLSEELDAYGAARSAMMLGIYRAILGVIQAG
jgi:hypothetical protein